jgi:hypothetical protein
MSATGQLPRAPYGRLRSELAERSKADGELVPLGDVETEFHRRQALDLKSKVFKDRVVRFRVVEGQGCGEGDFDAGCRTLLWWCSLHACGNLGKRMAQHLKYDAVERLTFSLYARDRLIGTEDSTVYVVWEGASKEAVHGFVLHWGPRAIHFVADLAVKGSLNPTTNKKEETVEWTIIDIGTRSWRSDVSPFRFTDPGERRVACELAVKALTVFPGTYHESIVTHTAAELVEGLRRSLYGRIH